MEEKQKKNEYKKGYLNYVTQGIKYIVRESKLYLGQSQECINQILDKTFFAVQSTQQKLFGNNVQSNNPNISGIESVAKGINIDKLANDAATAIEFDPSKSGYTCVTGIEWIDELFTLGTVGGKYVPRGVDLSQLARLLISKRIQVK